MRNRPVRPVEPPDLYILIPGSLCIDSGPGSFYIRPQSPYSLESVGEEIT